MFVAAHRHEGINRSPLQPFGSSLLWYVCVTERGFKNKLGRSMFFATFAIFTK